MIKDACILQVEDDENDVFLLNHAFKTVGLSKLLRVVTDGGQAIDYLDGRGEFADRKRYAVTSLIILDLKLPRVSGFEVLHWLRHASALSHLPVIIFSSSAHPGDIDRAYGMGANSFVVKPSTLHERAAFARAIRDYWLQFNESPAACFE